MLISLTTKIISLHIGESKHHVVQLKYILKTNDIHIRNPMASFLEWKTDPNLIQYSKGTQIAKTVFKKKDTKVSHSLDLGFL